VTDQPDLSTLPKRMRYAADVIAEYVDACPNLDTGTQFAAPNLRIAADRYEQKCIRMVANLAQSLYELGWRKVTADHAQALVESGWRKGDSS
jgi:hypothetical protein